MKTVFTTALSIISGMAMAATSQAEKAISNSGFSFAEHFKLYSWIYIFAFIGLIGFFVAGYLFGWDKKLFKGKTSEDQQLFI